MTAAVTSLTTTLPHVTKSSPYDWISFLFFAIQGARAVIPCTCRRGVICTSHGTHTHCFLQLGVIRTTHGTHTHCFLQLWGHTGRSHIDDGTYMHCHPKALLSARRSYKRAYTQSDAIHITNTDLKRNSHYTTG